MQLATEKELKTLTHIVYLIINKINQKKYIGISTKTFYERYHRKRWTQAVTNRYLKRAIKKYGFENFEVYLLEANVNNLNKLNELEISYIKNFDCLVPNGYNFLQGGELRNHNIKSRETMAKTRRPEGYKFKNHKTGEIVFVQHLKVFCDTYGLKESNMCSVANKRSKRHSVWTLPETKLKSWTLRSPTGIDYYLVEGELESFCETHQLDSYMLTKVCNGKMSHHRKWTCPNFCIPEKTHKLKSPDGQIFEIKKGELQKFCEQNKLSITNIYQVLAKKTLHHRFWVHPETVVEYHLVIDPQNKLFKIPKNFVGAIKNFAKNNGLKFKSLSALIYGDQKTCAGWRVP